MEIEVIVNDAVMTDGNWIIAIFIPKINSEIETELNVITRSFIEMGIYSEITPVKGSTKINFVDHERLVIMYGEGKSHYEYKYELRDDVIRIASIEYPDGWGNLYFRIINNRKFEIGYLHFHIPEYYPPPMIFEKE